MPSCAPWNKTHLQTTVLFKILLTLSRMQCSPMNLGSNPGTENFPTSKKAPKAPIRCFQASEGRHGTNTNQTTFRLLIGNREALQLP